MGHRGEKRPGEACLSSVILNGMESSLSHKNESPSPFSLTLSFYFILLYFLSISTPQAPLYKYFHNNKKCIRLARKFILVFPVRLQKNPKNFLTNSIKNLDISKRVS